jgi:hypothetical protein
MWIAALSFAAVLLAGCEAAPKVQTTLDPQANMAGYRTFSFLESAPKAAGAITDERVRGRLRHMIAMQLMERGYTPATPGQAGDLGVHYTGQVAAKQSVLIVGTPGPHDYGWGNRELGGYDTMSYREGTLFIDLVDISKRTLVWRAHVTEALTPGYSEENWKKVDRALDEAFKSLPQRK